MELKRDDRLALLKLREYLTLSIAQIDETLYPPTEKTEGGVPRDYEFQMEWDSPKSYFFNLTPRTNANQLKWLSEVVHGYGLPTKMVLRIDDQGYVLFDRKSKK